jgi:hypothetical protein
MNQHSNLLEKNIVPEIQEIGGEVFSIFVFNVLQS